MTQSAAVLTPPSTVPPLRARLALLAQRFPLLWRGYQLAKAIAYVRPVDLPYAAEMFWTILRVVPVTEGGPRLVSLFRLTREVMRDGVPGDLVECGVALGGTVGLIGVASRRSTKHVWLYDTFAGLPAPEDVDGSAAPEYVGMFRGTLDDVRGRLRAMNVADSRTHLVQGLFEDTLPRAEVGQIALLHIDGDWYRSVLTCLEELYDHVAPGGVVVLDDYGYWPGCRIATDEFLASRGITAPLVRVDAARRYFRKPIA
jgi:O-methyltransferase